MKRLVILRFALVLLLGACRESAPVEPVSRVPAWEPGRAYDTALLPRVRGMRDYRGIIHLHSYLSHDACDGHDDPGFTDAACLVHLRDAMCLTQQDFILLTDHPDYMHEHEFPVPLLYDAAAGDELVTRGKTPVANHLRCPDGRTVLLQAGYESNAFMPAGLHGHALPPGDARRALYGGSDTATAEALVDAGALLFMPHSESKDHAWYSKLPFAAMEIYNLHANLDPDIRVEYLGKDEAGYFGTLLKFTNTAPSAPHPDLSFLSFFEANDTSLTKWETLLLEKKIAGIAGTDAHENVFTSKMRDGERGDGYRRLMSFFSNHVLSPDPLDADVAKQAVEALRAYIAFEALGVPAGFDFHAAGDRVYEMGEDAPRGAELVVTLPAVLGLAADAPRPTVSAVLYRIDEAGRHEVASGETDLRFTADQPGIYRAEVRIVPHHLRPYLADLADALIKVYPWVYANPIFVR